MIQKAEKPLPSVFFLCFTTKIIKENSQQIFHLPAVSWNEVKTYFQSG
ncbi:hypothetical protein D920_00917 [Enterococcus faecalis 13-SD-W-01]|nr:hypothetical protein D920_00917 [Enterococcus faecalis 13-SD-W-01]